MSIEDIVDKSAAEHHHLIEVFDRHPLGADWKQFCKWVDEDH